MYIFLGHIMHAWICNKTVLSNQQPACGPLIDLTWPSKPCGNGFCFGAAVHASLAYTLHSCECKELAALALLVSLWSLALWNKNQWPEVYKRLYTTVIMVFKLIARDKYIDAFISTLFTVYFYFFRNTCQLAIA